jgi:hypothetical protein
MGLTTLLRGGEHRILGLLPRVATVGELAFAPLYEDNFPIIARENWTTLATADAKRMVDAATLPVLDQNGIGCCGAASAVTAVMNCRQKAGLAAVQLAMGRLYHYSGGGHDNGSTLSDNLQFSMSLGIPPVTSREQELDYRWPWTRDERQQAPLYRILAACDCPSFDALASAVQDGWDVQHGIIVTSSYDVDDTGIWINDPSGDEKGGHAQCSPALGLVYDDAKNRFGLLVQGTWGAQFGYKGYYIVPESCFLSSPFNDGWSVRFCATPDGEAPLPVPSVQ